MVKNFKMRFPKSQGLIESVSPKVSTNNVYEKIYDTHAIVESIAMSVGEGGDSVGKAELDALLLAGLREDSRVFDFGCGTGRLTQFLAPYLKSGQYFGSDISSEMLKILESQLGKMSNVNLYHQVEYLFPELPQKVDFIAAFSVFTHMEPEDTYCYLKSMHDMCTDHTQLVVSILDIDSNLGQLVFRNQASIPFGERWNAVRNFVTSAEYFLGIANLAGWSLKHWITDSNQEFTPFSSAKENYHFGQSIAVMTPAIIGNLEQ